MTDILIKGLLYSVWGERERERVCKRVRERGSLTVKKEMKCSGDSEKVRATTRKSKEHEIIRLVSRTISCSISESPKHFSPF